MTDNLQPNTTAEQDLHTAGARRINVIWEFTQALIATSVVWAVLYSCVRLIGGAESRSDALLVLVGAFNLVIGFYFGRTNHARSGGMPEK